MHGWVLLVDMFTAWVSKGRCGKADGPVPGIPLGLAP